MLVNLLSNAYKFTEPGGTISIKTSMDGPETMLIEVHDTGPGIAKDQLTMIFGRFNRASTPASRKAGGTGLGLAIAQSIVAQHGGRIWCENHLGQGAHFYFTLPVRGSPETRPFPAPNAVWGGKPSHLVASLLCLRTEVDHNGRRVD